MVGVVCAFYFGICLFVCLFVWIFYLFVVCLDFVCWLVLQLPVCLLMCFRDTVVKWD